MWATAPILDCEQLFLVQSNFYEVENSMPLMELEPTTFEYMSSDLTTNLRECDTFQFIVRDTGSGKIAIFVTLNWKIILYGANQ